MIISVPYMLFPRFDAEIIRWNLRLFFYFRRDLLQLFGNSWSKIRVRSSVVVETIVSRIMSKRINDADHPWPPQSRCIRYTIVVRFDDKFSVSRRSNNDSLDNFFVFFFFRKATSDFYPFPLGERDAFEVFLEITSKPWGGSRCESVDRKMLCRKVVVVLLVCLFSIVCGMPHASDNSQDSSGVSPLFLFIILLVIFDRSPENNPDLSIVSREFRRQIDRVNGRSA